MRYRTNIKIGEITNLADARFAAGTGATFIGFSLSPEAKNYITPQKAQEISQWVTGPVIICEWDTCLVEIASDTALRLSTEYIQLNQVDSVVSQALKDFQLIQNIELSATSHPSEIIEVVDKVGRFTKFYSLSFSSEESQELFLSHAGNRLALIEFSRDFPVFFNFYFSSRNIAEIVGEFKPFAINLKGSKEIKPGYNDFEELDELISNIEISG